MNIKINAPKVVRLAENEFEQCARGLSNTLSTNILNTGDQIRIKEHNGSHYTGHEIHAEVRSVEDGQVTIKKFSITHDEKIGSQNKRDVSRKVNTKNRFNAYI